MNNKISFFLPTRKGSERVKNKNTRPFANIEGGLVENKIRQLLSTKFIDEIIFSSNDKDCIYNPQNEMFRLWGTKRSFSQNETFFFSHP